MYEISIKDPYTNQSFSPKRSNQRFASAKNRIAFNNLKAKNIRKAKEKIDKPLSKNFKILKDIMSNEKEQVFHKEFLLGKGFDFEVFTGGDKNGEFLYPCYYDFIITPIKEKIGYVKIKRI